MFDAIINAFFIIKKENKPITYLSKRQISENFRHINKSHQNIGGVRTELSKYFTDNIGLNTLERAKASNNIVMVYSLR